MSDEGRAKILAALRVLTTKYESEERVFLSAVEAHGPPDAAPKNGETGPSSRDSVASSCAYSSKDLRRFARSQEERTISPTELARNIVERELSVMAGRKAQAR